MVLQRNTPGKEKLMSQDTQFIIELEEKLRDADEKWKFIFHFCT